MTKFLKIFFLLLFLSINTFFPQNKWKKLNSVTSKNLNKVFFLDTLKGWSAGEAGIVLFTTNGGANWEYRNIATLSNIKDIFFLDSLHGWALHDSISNNNILSILSFTSDQGKTWQENPNSFIDQILNSVLFIDSLTGFLTAEQGNIYKTDDAGISWKETKLNAHPLALFPKKDIKFYNKQIGFIAGGKIDIAGACWFTNDFGETWETRGLAPEPINGLYILDSANIIGFGGDYEYGSTFCSTSDGGNFWTVKYLNIFGMGLAIAQRVKNEYWACINAVDSLLCSYDAGNSWISYAIPNSEILSDIIFVDSSKGFAVGKAGVIYKYDVNNPTGLNYETKANNFQVFQNFPNPFNPSTNISFNTDIAQNINISVYNLLGQKIATVLDEYCSPGYHNSAFNGSPFPSGCYFYIIKGADFISQHKMVLLK